MLLTGFEPYGGHATNPSSEIARALDGEIIAGTKITSAILPVTFKGLATRMDELIRLHHPKAIISLGLFPGETLIRLERVGVNRNDFKHPDNSGAIEKSRIEESGPERRMSTLPVDTILKSLLDTGIPARTSNTAGSFICNALLYSTLGILEKSGRSIPCGFIHIPFCPEQVAESIKAAPGDYPDSRLASMDLSTSIRAIRTAIEVTLDQNLV